MKMQFLLAILITSSQIWGAQCSMHADPAHLSRYPGLSSSTIRSPHQMPPRQYGTIEFETVSMPTVAVEDEGQRQPFWTPGAI